MRILQIQHYSTVTFFAFFCFVALHNNAQTLVPLSENQTIKKYLQEKKIHKKSTNKIATLQLPFFDDFSKMTVFPNQDIWQDNYAFINHTYSINPVTFGVATLDAIDENGNVYDVSSNPTSCDFLTSQPIDLSSYQGTSKEIHLSFFYQPGGNGETPEYKDSLVVEFFQPDSNEWYSVWNTPGMENDTFFQQIIKVPEIYFQPEFKFRFRNYASISTEEEKWNPGKISNFDHWNIDYVRLDTNSYEDHQNVYDVSIINALSSSFKTYQSIPWDHVDSAGFNHIREYIPLTIRMNNQPPNLGESTTIGRGYFVRDLSSGTYLIDPYIEGSQSFKFDTIYERNDVFITPVLYDGSDVGMIEIGAFLNNTPGIDYKSNDTVKRVEVYRNYYAYDDGTAEMGFGISGESTQGSLIACHFEIYKTDSLRAIDILFNKTKDNFTADKPFQICVWKNDNGIPGDRIYFSEEYDYPDPNLPFGQFQRILLDSAVFISHNVFIGLKQNTDEFLNIGYDINNGNKNQVYYNISGGWQTLGGSFTNGSLMIRPVMGHSPIVLKIPGNKRAIHSQAVIYPNPATDFITIELEQSVSQEYTIMIFDAVGNLHLSSLHETGPIDIRSLKPGIYILEISLSNHDVLINKFVVTR